MKNAKVILLACIILILIVGCTKAPLPEETQRFENFAFVISYSPCGFTPLDYYDSGNKALTHNPLGDPNQYTTTLEMTTEELDKIFQEMVETGYFNLPAELVPPSNMETAYVSPNGEYGIAVVNGSIQKTVHWRTEIITVPLYDDAKHFRELVDFIHSILRAHEEYRELPRNTAACA